MDRFLKLIGLLTCLIVMGYGVYWLIQHFPKYVEPTLKGLGVVALLVLVVRLYLGRDWLKKTGKEFVIGSDLIKATENLLNDLPKPKNETTANFIGHLVYRFTRLGLIGLMLALIPITLLYQQNQLLSTQNEKIDKQNIRLDQQTYLQEAERRSSLVFLFSNVMDAIDRELKEDYGNDSIRNLSPQLIGRIVGLSTRLKPYRYLDGDTLIAKPLSPERGQLLIALHGSELSKHTMHKICKKSDFSYADLRGIDLTRANLVFANLSYANLEKANLEGVKLGAANLKGTNFFDTKLLDANLKQADLRKANLVDANLSYANLSQANLIDANMGYENFSHADFVDRGSLGRDFSFTDLVLKYLNYSGSTDVNLFNGTLIDEDFINEALAKKDSSSANQRAKYFAIANTSDYAIGKSNANDVLLWYFYFWNTELAYAEIGKDFIQRNQKYEREDTIIGSHIFKHYRLDSGAYSNGNLIYSLKPKK